jgi:hypothetical protein
MDNPHIVNLGPKSASVAALGGAEVYKALGAGDNITYWSDIQDGTHCANRPGWRTPLQQNIQKYLLKTGGAAGSFHISGKAAGNLAEWRDWTTPALSGSTSGPSASPSVPASPSASPSAPASPSASPSSVPGGGCTATASINQWTGGFVATIRVTAGASPISGWTVSSTLPSGAGITNAWNANRSGNSGAVQFTNVQYNGAVAAGQSTEFGFQGTGTATGLIATCTAR